MRYRNDTVFDFGEYEGLTLDTVVEADPMYIKHLYETRSRDEFEVSNTIKSKLGLTDIMNFTKRYREVLGMMATPLARRILSLDGINVVTDITDVKPGEATGTVTGKRIGTDREVTMKIGKFINDLVNNNKLKCVTSQLPTSFSGRDVEMFINEFKAVQNYESMDDFLALVHGTDIAKYYHEQNYFERSGSLGSSCMRHGNCSNYLKIYVFNPDDVSMLVLKDPASGKVMGRAIVWKNAEFDMSGRVIKNAVFMDRIYTSKEHNEKIFKMYADKMGWFYKSAQSYNNANSYVYKGMDVIGEMKAYVKNTNWDFYPYMDTLQYLYRDHVSNKRERGCLGSMRSTGGSLSRC